MDLISHGLSIVGLTSAGPLPPVDSVPLVPSAGPSFFGLRESHLNQHLFSSSDVDANAIELHQSQRLYRPPSKLNDYVCNIVQSGTTPPISVSLSSSSSGMYLYPIHNMIQIRNSHMGIKNFLLQLRLIQNFLDFLMLWFLHTGKLP